MKCNYFDSKCLIDSPNAILALMHHLESSTAYGFCNTTTERENHKVVSLKIHTAVSPTY